MASKTAAVSLYCWHMKLQELTRTNAPVTNTIAGISIPTRIGAPPAVVGPMPHRQESEYADPQLVDALIDSINALPGVTVSTRGAFIGRSFIGEGARNWNAHIHHYEDGDHQDGSMHIQMPQWVSAEIEKAGWGVRHPAYPVMLLIYSPRNAAENETITKLVNLSYEFAKNN